MTSYVTEQSEFKIKEFAPHVGTENVESSEHVVPAILFGLLVGKRYKLSVDTGKNINDADRISTELQELAERGA